MYAQFASLLARTECSFEGEMLETGRKGGSEEKERVKEGEKYRSEGIGLK